MSETEVAARCCTTCSTWVLYPEDADGELVFECAADRELVIDILERPGGFDARLQRAQTCKEYVPEVRTHE